MHWLLHIHNFGMTEIPLLTPLAKSPSNRFVQNINLELWEDLNIHQVITEAFAKLGNTGIIQSGKNHSCAKYSQPYKHTTDFMANEDPAAVIGSDKNSAVPALTEEFADLSIHEAAEM